MPPRVFLFAAAAADRAGQFLSTNIRMLVMCKARHCVRPGMLRLSCAVADRCSTSAGKIARATTSATFEPMRRLQQTRRRLSDRMHIAVE